MKEAEQTIITTLKFKFPQIAEIRLTKTMLDKQIIDANESVRKFAFLHGIDYSEMTNGDKKSLQAQFSDGTACSINFYRTKSRSDRRVSISGLKKQGDAGDLIAISWLVGPAYSSEKTIVINITRHVADSGEKLFQHVEKIRVANP